MHHRRSSHRIEIAGLWRVDPRLALGHDNDGLVFPERIDKLNGTFPTHGQQQNRVREQYGVPYREYRKSLLFVYFLILRSALDGRLLAHYVSLSVTRSSLDVTLSRKVSEARKYRKTEFYTVRTMIERNQGAEANPAAPFLPSSKLPSSKWERSKLERSYNPYKHGSHGSSGRINAQDFHELSNFAQMSQGVARRLVVPAQEVQVENILPRPSPHGS